jgi:hypothetical protein
LISAGRYGGTGAGTNQGTDVVSAGYYSSGGGTSATPSGAGNGCVTGQSCGKTTAGYFASCGATSTTPNSTVGGASGNGSNGCLSGCSCGLLSAGRYGGAGEGANTGSGAIDPGYYCSGGGTSATPSSSGNGCVSGQSCGICNGAVYATGGAPNCSACPVHEDTWTQGTGTGWYTITQCFETKNATDISSYCSQGQAKKMSKSDGTWDTATASITFKAKAGARVTGLTCVACGVHSNSPADNTLSVCPCDGGYYMSSGTCTAVGAGYWSADANDSRNQCPSGLTTIGYGPGANEANDCGRKLHIGNNVIYLRSNRKTEHTYNVKVGNATYYGNMTTADTNMNAATDKKLKVNFGNTTYSVYDDSVTLP